MPRRMGAVARGNDFGDRDPMGTISRHPFGWTTRVPRLEGWWQEGWGWVPLERVRDPGEKVAISILVAASLGCQRKELGSGSTWWHERLWVRIPEQNSVGRRPRVSRSKASGKVEMATCETHKGLGFRRLIRLTMCWGRLKLSPAFIGTSEVISDSKSTTIFAQFWEHCIRLWQTS